MGNDEQSCREELPDTLPSPSDDSPSQGTGLCTNLTQAAGLRVDHLGALVNLQVCDNPFEQRRERHEHDGSTFLLGVHSYNERNDRQQRCFSSRTFQVLHMLLAPPS